ncbi:MAG TPA: hypothetical protein VFC37_00125 [Terracidiphilus sp.]|nr:hypothetical protein [Terracidiphilus sp.]
MRKLSRKFSGIFRASSRIGLVVVNGSTLCGNHGNCPYYLFLNVKDRALLIFQDAGNGPIVEPAVHHGMHDISSIDVMSAGIDDAVEVFEFDCKDYKPAYCYEVKADQNGRVKASPHHPCH